MPIRKHLIEKIKANGQNFDLKLIEKALDLAYKYHGKQTRASGEPYITHPIAVAEIIVDMNLDSASVITALLHDTVEDTDLTIEQVEEEFGKDVASLVAGVTKLTRLEFKSDQIKQAENFRKLLLAMSEDIRVLLVKLADRLHNMRTIDFLPSEEKRQKISLETMEIYAPLAERIGMHQCKTELQDIAFRILYPNVRESILSRLNEIAENGSELIEKIIIELGNHLKEASIDNKIFGRQKTPHSIWMKMKQKNVGFDQLSDIIAFRIVVHTVQDCYRALGVIHTSYKMVPGSFQDFISTPKNNGYQSMHTVVIGPLKQRIEIQIRTEEMHEIAELGVAAHWKYKQQYNAPDGKQFRWIRELLHILDQAKDPEEFISNTKLAMYYDQVFCFTPKGKLIALPKGATAVDFAYSVHSKVGFHCAGVKINGNVETLRKELRNGDQVEIITNKTQVPDPAWEEFVITGRARAEIKKYVRQQRIEQCSILGKDMLEMAFKNVGLELTKEHLKKAENEFKKTSAEDLFCAVGEGIIPRDDVVKLFKLPATSLVEKLSIFKFKKPIKSNEAISIKGLVPGMAIHYAVCCHPIPGDNIVGVMHAGKGITIHVDGCDYLKHLDKNDFDTIPLSWDTGSENQIFITRIMVKILNTPGGLAVLAIELAKEKSNVANFKILNRNKDFFEVLVDIEVNSVEHLLDVIEHLKMKQEIIQIERHK